MSQPNHRSPIVFDIRAYGAAGDGQTLDTQALQATIDACARHGGGTVCLPAGRYLSGSLFLRSNITLRAGQPFQLAPEVQLDAVGAD